MRTELLELAVWRDVCALLAHPERLAEEYRRRLLPDTRAQRMPLATLEAHLGKLRQGLARLIDSYSEWSHVRAIPALKKKFARSSEEYGRRY
ncbi:MAG: hypothetical protein ACRERE_05365 [Candidatus Entotheonellia bacterium]